jgi:hypothetical protein
MGNTFDAILVTVKAATAGNALPFATVPQKENFAWYRFKTGQPRTKKVLIHRRVRREVFYFLYKPFLLRDLCALCGKKNILPGYQGTISSIHRLLL